MKNTIEPTYHHGDLKNSLIVAALEMIEKDGVNSMTLRELTKKVGASRSAIYRHFSSKNELLKSIIKEAIKKLDEYTITSIPTTNILDDLYIMGKSYINFAIKNPNIYRMIFGNEARKQREEVCDIYDANDAAGFHKLIELIKLAQETNLIKKDDAMMQATVIWSTMHGLSNLLIDGHIHIQDNFETLYDLSFNTLITGMKA
ncbi:MAG: TetR family transcriptional regulator [Sulfurimonas sp.]|nr:MAG: TetR family transcriptional regulator [Sulfurimonas sp.]